LGVYNYKAKNLQGKTIEGETTAANEAELKAYIRSQGYFIVSYAESVENVDLFKSFRKVKVKDITIFCRQFAVLFNSGITILETIEILMLQTGNKKMKDVLRVIYDDIRKGKVLSEAMDLHDSVFPEFLRNMIKVGEVSGNLDEILNRMADYYERDNKIKNKVKAAMTYPVVLFFLMIAVVIVLLTVVIPIFADTLMGFGATLPPITQFMINMSDFVKARFLWIIAGISGGVVLLLNWKKSNAGREVIDRLMLRLPIIKGVSEKIITARFSRSLSILLRSGISMLDAIEIMSKLLGNREVEKRFITCREEVRKGNGLSKAITTVGIFPPLLTQMIAVGERTGELDEILSRTAGFFDDEVEEAVGKATTLIEPIMLILMAIVVGSILVSVMLPLMKIMETTMDML
jgi:type IV pilus assembly protein PilC